MCFVRTNIEKCFSLKFLNITFDAGIENGKCEPYTKYNSLLAVDFFIFCIRKTYHKGQPVAKCVE
jgi:hypothetical protein